MKTTPGDPGVGPLAGTISSSACLVKSFGVGN